MPTLKDIVERSDTPIGRVFDLSIQFFIILSLIAFSVETLPGLDPGWVRLLHFFEIASITVFSVEYLVRLLVADRKIAFMTSFFGVVV